MLPSLSRLELPRLAPGIERVHHGEDDLMTRAPNPRGAAGYLRLEPADERLMELMDGTRTPAEIAVESFRRGGGLAFTRLNRLLEALKLGGFLVQPAVDVYAALRQRLTPKTRRPLWARVPLRPASLLQINVWAWTRADAFFAIAHRWGGWVLFQPWFVLPACAAAVAGFVLLLIEYAQGHYDLFKTSDSYILGVITLVAVDCIVVASHDLCHGLAMKHINRYVMRAGVMLYYFAPVVYVDSTDAWMAKRRDRILVSWAGPFSGLLLGGIAGFVAAFPPSDFTGEFAFKLATISFMTSLFNLIPLLELDGYYILVDLVNMPMLRARSLDFARRELPGRLIRLFRGTRPMTREERFLLGFGAASLVFSVLMAVFGFLLLGRRVERMVSALWSQDDFYARPLVVVMVAVLLLPLVMSLFSAGRAVARRPVAYLAAELRLRMPGSLSGILRGANVFADLSTADLELLAEHVSRRRVSAGAAVVREGEPSDEFFVISSGAAGVFIDGRGKVREMGSGEFFGELALLERAPRSATVVAETEMSLVVLDAGHFRRWTQERPEVREQFTRRIRERDELAALPLFAGIERDELDGLLVGLESVRFNAGEAIVAEGDSGDALYLIAEGRAEVTQGTRHLRYLEAGDYFGEVALLNDTPRTATVTAVAPLRAYCLSKANFDWLLSTAGGSRVLAGIGSYPDVHM